MPVITIIIKSLATFSNGQVIIIGPGGSYIKKICSSFAGTNSFAVDAFHSLVIVFVLHIISFTVS